MHDSCMFEPCYHMRISHVRNRFCCGAGPYALRCPTETLTNTYFVDVLIRIALVRISSPQHYHWPASRSVLWASMEGWRWQLHNCMTCIVSYSRIESVLVRPLKYGHANIHSFTYKGGHWRKEVDRTSLQLHKKTHMEWHVLVIRLVGKCNIIWLQMQLAPSPVQFLQPTANAQQAAPHE